MTSAEKGALWSKPKLYSIRWRNGLIQTSSSVTRGSTNKIATMGRDNHLARPVYWSAKASRSVGAPTEPSHPMLSQKRVLDKSGLTSSKAYASAHSATASMSRQNAVAPGAGRRCHAIYASQAHITAEAATGNTYGVKCQCIGHLLSDRPLLLH